MNIKGEIDLNTDNSESDRTKMADDSNMQSS